MRIFRPDNSHSLSARDHQIEPCNNDFQKDLGVHPLDQWIWAEETSSSSSIDPGRISIVSTSESGYERFLGESFTEYNEGLFNIMNDDKDSSDTFVIKSQDSPISSLKRSRETQQLSFSEYDSIFDQTVLYNNTPENLLSTDLQIWVDEKKPASSECNGNKRHKTADTEYSHRKKAQEKILECYYKKGIRLDLDDLRLSSLPKSVGYLTHLKELQLSGNELNTLPTEIGNLTNLQKLLLSFNPLRTLPKEITSLTKLQKLELFKCQLTTLPKEIGHLKNLQELELSGNWLTAFPKEICNLTGLQFLFLSENQLSALPIEIGNIRNLKMLDLSKNQLSNLSKEIGDLGCLQVLDLSKNQLSTLPTELFKLRSLTSLYFSGNRLRTFSAGAEIRSFSTLREIDLSNNQLSAFPEEILSLEHLRELDLSNNQITTLSGSIFTYLERTSMECFLDGNPIFQNFHEEEAEKAGADLKNLLKRWLDISSDADVSSSISSIYEKLLSEPSKDFLALLLTRLESSNYMPADCKENPQKFRARIQSILKKGCSSDDARKILCSRAQSATERCGDGLIHELDNLELALDLLQVGKLDYQPLAKFLLKVYRQKRLDEYVEEFLKQRPHDESIETSLFFRIQLRDLLPISTENMIHRKCANISESEAPSLINDAKEFITKDCKTLEEQAKVLYDMDPWIEKVEAHTEYNSLIATMHIKLEEAKKNEKEYFTISNRLMDEIKKWKLTFTQNILK